MTVTFGCVLSQTIYGPTASPAALRTLAQQAEAVGFDAVWFADHIIIPRHVHALPTRFCGFESNSLIFLAIQMDLAR